MRLDSDLQADSVLSYWRNSLLYEVRHLNLSKKGANETVPRRLALSISARGLPRNGH